LTAWPNRRCRGIRFHVKNGGKRLIAQKQNGTAAQNNGSKRHKTVRNARNGTKRHKTAQIFVLAQIWGGRFIAPFFCRQ
jgi:hypothetical protein